MSIRTLVEFNHDRTDTLDEGFIRALKLYLATGSEDYADILDGYGVKVIADRHHTEEFRFDPEAVPGMGRVKLK